jgi:hypothetical protein
VIGLLLGRCQHRARGQKLIFRFKHKQLSRDGAMIDLCLPVCDWATCRRALGVIKLHPWFQQAPKIALWAGGAAAHYR